MSDSTNPLLNSLKLPGRIFQLPSKGLFYSNGELDPSIQEGEIHVHALSALDEINLKNPDQLFSGEAVNTVFRQCISGINKPAELLAKDVDAIMLFLRAVTYGNQFEFMARHGCEDGKDHSYIADIDVIINEMKMIDPTMVESMYTVKLQNNQIVKLRPNKYIDLITIIKKNQNKKEISVEDQRENLKSMLLGVIENVDGINDQKLIAEWIDKISAPLVNRIGDKIENVNEWGSSLNWKCICKDCNEPFEIQIPINPVSFFTE